MERYIHQFLDRNRMKKKHILYYLIILFINNYATAQHIQPGTKAVLDKLEQ